jgi:hypothetical protein
MSQRVVIPLLVATAFGAGFFARSWTVTEVALPPPPLVGSEFAHGSGPAAPDAKPDAKPAGSRPIDRAKLIADIERSRAQVDTYQKRMEEIEADFERDFVAILDPAQRQHYDAMKKEKVARFAKMASQPREDHSLALMTDEQIERSRRSPLLRALDTVAITPRFNYVNREYKLSEAQQPLALQILQSRREKFLRLIDEIPPPTIQFTGLAPLVQKLGDSPAPSPAK